MFVFCLFHNGSYKPITKSIKQSQEFCVYWISMQTFVALDLETTGFDPLQDQMIEIAAVRFTEDEILEKYETLVNPGIPVPPIITHITGIRNEDLTDAPAFKDISGKLVNFIGNSPIVGHNISFDISFLNGKGMNLLNPLYDTLQLSSILLPGLASYSLDTLSRVLKIVHEKKHRAMSDTLACHKLFTIMLEKIAGIEPGSLSEIQKLLGKSTWTMKDLFAGHADKTAKGKSSKNKPPLPVNKIVPEPEKTIVKNEIGDDLFGTFFQKDGPLSRIINDHEPRPSQEKMAALIDKSFTENSSLLVEAGTGTGKTLAYLLAGVRWSLKTGMNVMVSTYTRNLQGQIMDKDLPLLKKTLESLDQPVHFTGAVLKGRKNYLSTKRLEAFLDRDFFLDHEATILIKILLWLKKSDSGDMEELSLQGKEYSVLEELCCAEYVCHHQDPDYAAGCYLLKARERAESADIIVVNHALLMQDALAESPLLPENRHLIIDEAHHLEHVATESMTVSISYHSFLRPFEGLLRIFEEISRQSDGLFGKPGHGDSLKTMKSQIHSLVSRIEIFFGLIGIFMEKNLEPSHFQYHLNLKEEHYGTLDWQKVIAASRAISATGTEFIGELESFHESAGLEEKTSREIKNYLYECGKKLKDLDFAVSGEKREDHISWLFKGYEGGVSLKCAPANIGTTLGQILFDKKDSVILTSATLRTDKTFKFIREQLSLDEHFKEQYLPSHFDFPDQVKILIPEDLPEPATEGYFISCANLIENIVIKNKGRTMVLFTSKKALSATYHEIADRLKGEGYTVLAQNITGGRGKILEHFKDEPDKCVIFGTASFWEGVDIKGNDLTCVVMQKLPFDPPEDPIILARSRKYMDSFSQYQLPRAILKFKQGFGRLIRSSKDTGSIVILDTRIVQKGYGRQFLESLPEGIKIEYESARRLPDLL
jgi:predicted DnaQ family exonuclease/DinG family helicase